MIGHRPPFPYGHLKTDQVKGRWFRGLRFLKFFIRLLENVLVFSKFSDGAPFNGQDLVPAYA